MKVTVEATATADVEVAPEVAARVAACLSTYQELKVQADLLTEAMDAEKANIKALMDEAGVTKASVDGVPLSVTTRDTSTLDKVRFVELGGSLAMLENATTKKAGKPYLIIGKTK